MKHFVTAGLLALALPLNAGAGLLNPIDPQGVADINNKVYKAPNVGLQAAPMKMWSGGSVPQSYQTAPMPAAATQGRVGMPIVPKAGYGTAVVPQANFTTKQADASDAGHLTEMVKTQPAPVNSRKLRPLSPGGSDELKQQLNNLQWITTK